MRGYIPPVNDNERLVVKKALELAKISAARQSFGFTQFLDERGLALTIAQLNKEPTVDFVSYGGTQDTLRNIICVYDSYLEPPSNIDFNISALQILCKGATKLTHRDFLGALMSLGIKREFVGDIIVSNGNCATLFVINSIKNLIMTDFFEVSRFKAIVSEPANDLILETNKNNEEKSISISSLRLDVILSSILNISRTTSSALVKNNSVKVCQIPVQSVHFMIQDNDILSIKGYGKFEISSIGEKTKKNRIYINYIKKS